MRLATLAFARRHAPHHQLPQRRLRSQRHMTSATASATARASATPRRVRVGVVGGGAAGVIAAKTLRAAGHAVVLFEKAAQLGGVWKYSPVTQTDASMYESLHTNLPTAVMQLDDFAFPPGRPSFVSHTDVLAYIQDYATHFHVTEVARLHSTVVGITKQPSEPSEPSSAGAWRIDVDSRERGAYSELVDKVLICNGHFAAPAEPTIPGLEHFKGETLHWHNYRTAAPFVDKSVLLLGCGPSGQDISLELAKPGVARQVTVAFKEVEEAEPSRFERRTLKPPIARILASGSIEFTDGTTQEAPDVIMLCTGYRYVVKHLAPAGILYPELPLPKGELVGATCDALVAATSAAAAIAPLYKQLFSIEEPDVAFVGLPFKNLPFLCFELQAKWAACVFAGDAALPSKQHMYEAFFEEVRALPFPVRKLHQLGAERQHQYFEELASFSSTKVSRNVQEMFRDAGMLRRTYPFHYREAQFTQDPALDGKWVRRLTLTDPEGNATEELVRTFE